MLRTHGWRKKYYPEILGYNSRLDELQAAILRVKLRHLDAWNERRRSLAQLYTERLSGSGIAVPSQAPGARHVYYLYVVRVPERAAVQRSLKEAGIGFAVYYPQLVHLAEPCRHLGSGGEAEFPVASQASRETLALPMYPEMSAAQVDEVAGVVCRALS